MAQPVVLRIDIQDGSHDEAKPEQQPRPVSPDATRPDTPDKSPAPRPVAPDATAPDATQPAPVQPKPARPGPQPQTTPGQSPSVFVPSNRPPSHPGPEADPTARTQTIGTALGLAGRIASLIGFGPLATILHRIAVGVDILSRVVPSYFATQKKKDAQASDNGDNKGKGILDTVTAGAKGMLANIVKPLITAITGPVGIALGVLTLGITAVVKVMNKLGEHFKKLGEELAYVSGPITVAQARAEVTKFQGDRFRASVLGDEISRITLAKARTDAALAKIGAVIQEPFAKMSAWWEEVKADIAEWFASFVDGGQMEDITKALDEMAKVMPNLGRDATAMRRVLDRMDPESRERIIPKEFWDLMHLPAPAMPAAPVNFQPGFDAGGAL